ncbi:MAG: HAD family phosphatase [Planctomycetota bacterium]
MDAIIFDFDGTLVDTEPMHESAIRAALRDHDVPVRPGMTIGLSDEDAIAGAFEEVGRSVPADMLADLCALKTRIYGELALDRDITVYEGAVELFRAASQRYRVGICTAAMKAEVQEVLIGLGITDVMSALVTADMVENKKPAPDGYLLAAEYLDVRPECAVAVEDSPRGVDAARAAGCTVVAVTHTTPAAELSHAHIVVDRIADIDLDAVARLVAAQS